MRFRPTPLPGVVVVEPEPHADERGLFARTFCAEEFERAGLEPELAQCSTSFSHRRGTLRGLHYQAAPFGEEKLVRCTRGRIWDVALDLRPESPAYLRHFALELSAENRLQLYLPPQVAHGFLTLEDGCEVGYAMSVPYVAEAARGVRWNDPAFGIPWPEPVVVISERDRDYPDFTP
ncbi:MAG TPA: dTDP-4-dehydrorhamnose 3,5-epimerase [Thermoanaerobaculia bacterium]|jgi:dTDP-4-dehydrorhamnose 3,5-epimerase|nr:dTDP-4-dehydrorhamnose 3,5-epimerase [Thermoanaerobaculia bacterium]